MSRLLAVVLGLLALFIGPMAAFGQDVPAQTGDLAATGWRLAAKQTNDFGVNLDSDRDLVFQVSFLPDGVAVVRRESAVMPGEWSIQDNLISISSPAFSAAWKLADGKARGKGTMGGALFDVIAFEKIGPIDLAEPYYQALVQHDICAFAGKVMRAAHANFWAMSGTALPFAMRGQTDSSRNSDPRYSAGVLSAKISGKSDGVEGIRDDYFRQVEGLQGCLVGIDGLTLGLEALIETTPTDKLHKQMVAVYRLRDAPEYLSDLRIMIAAEWGVSPWTIVHVGYEFGNDTIAGQAYRLGKQGLAWTPVSTPPPTAPRYPGTTPEQLLAAADALLDEVGSDAGKTRNFIVEALPYLHEACEQGLATACRRMGAALESGHSGARDIRTDYFARNLFQRACDANDGAACVAFGENMRAAIWFGTKDEGPANRAFARACELNDGAGCRIMGEDRLVGRGGFEAEDFAGAIPLLNRGCELGDKTACAKAGLIHFRGQPGVAENQTLARRQLEQGCDAADPAACRYAGAMAAAGVAGPKDESKAIVLFVKGCAAKDKESCEAIGQPVPD